MIQWLSHSHGFILRDVMYKYVRVLEYAVLGNAELDYS